MSDEVVLLWPERPTCHDHDPFAQRFEPPVWRPSGVKLHPDNDHVPAFRTCSFCGSIHPEDLYSALLAGAALGGSDWKYGWPHKFYVTGIPNPNKGNLVTTMSGTLGNMTAEERAAYAAPYEKRGGVVVWERDERPGRTGWIVKARTPDGEFTHSKWYNTHLNDLNDLAFSALAEAIMKHANIRFMREGDKLTYMAPRHGYQKA